MSPARKPVIVRLWTRQWFAGYLDAAPTGDGRDPDRDHDRDHARNLELLDGSGKVIHLPWESIKWVCYVRELTDAAGGDTAHPERLVRKRFTTRPRSAGVWVRLTLSDGDELEGLAANDRSLVAGAGLMLTPPDTRSNAQRLYVPAASIQELTVLAVIGPGGPGRGSSSMERRGGDSEETPANVSRIDSSGLFSKQNQTQGDLFSSKTDEEEPE